MSTAAIVSTNSARPQPRPRGELTIEHRASLAWSPEDAASVESLADDRPQVGIFLSHAWLSGFFEEPPEGCEPSVLILREAGALRGFVPLAISQRLTHTRVSLLGGGFGSDRIDLLAARGYESACADAVMAWLRGAFPRGFVFELRDVPGDSALWGAIGRASNDSPAGVVLVPREVYALPYLPLSENPMMTGAAPEPNDPASLARHRRWLERRGHLRIDTVTDVDDVQQAFDVLVRLLRSRWGSGRSALEDPRIQRFHRRVLPLLAREGRLRMMRFVADMRPIAVYYGVASRSSDPSVHRGPAAPRWWGYYLAGYDREWAGRIHLGRVALAAAIDLAANDGAREFDFLKGPEPVKYLWPVRERITVDADVYSRARGPALTSAARAARIAIGALARALRGAR